MLVLSRKVGESVVIDGGIVIRVLAVRGGRIRLGIEAPADVTVRRCELAPARRPAVLPACNRGLFALGRSS